MAFTDSAHLHSCCSLFWNYTAGGEKLKEAENESECSAEGRKCSDAFSMDTIVTTHMTHTSPNVLFKTRSTLSLCVYYDYYWNEWVISLFVIITDAPKCTFSTAVKVFLHFSAALLL